MPIRYAFRQLHKRIGFSLTVIVTLALGVGANLAIFQLLQAVLLTPLPVANPSELYALHTVQSPFDAQWFYSYPAYERLSRQAPVLAHSGIGSGILQTGDGFSQEASLQMVSPNFFSVLGLTPAAGRLFQPSDDTQGQSELPVILSYNFARKQFAASAISTEATLNRVPVVVVGIAPGDDSGEWHRSRNGADAPGRTKRADAAVRGEGDGSLGAARGERRLDCRRLAGDPDSCPPGLRA